MVLRCPRCDLRMISCPDGRVHCMSCARYYKITLTEDKFGPFTPEEEYRNLNEFLEEALIKKKGRRL